MARVVLAMSGGVDSSVAAELLRAAGHEVIGVFMRHGETAAAPATTCRTGAATEVAAEANAGASAQVARGDRPGGVQRARLPIIERPAHKQGCCSASDAEDARRVADRLDIPFYALDFQDEFGRIIDYFVAEYAAARTPNPCVVCNTWLKFGRLFEYADSVAADFVATGHYARIVSAADGIPALAVGVDEAKDQSYALFGINRSLLARMLLPVGGYRKPEIREIAQRLGLRVADKKESQEICFVPDGDHAAFIRARVGPSATSGAIVTTTGEVVGHHDGLERFTIGQRKGLGVALGEPRFVVRLEPESGRVVVGSKAELAREELTAANTNWLTDAPQSPFSCSVKIRYNSRRVPAV
ncbi:MAG TPA: tRNA 2-thiouridine(34) synthase MnmA, partial [Pirellulales bacterium]|nr:tRNA 2-thiouridine(34) synthase MnmA [Pirellulales bacterium]